jgi:hypothetical protein
MSGAKVAAAKKMAVLGEHTRAYLKEIAEKLASAAGR